MRSFLKTFLAVILANILIFLTLVGIVASRMKKPVEVGKGTVLVQVLDGEIPESGSTSGFELPGSGPLTYSGLLENLEKARHDERIRAVVLKLGGPGLGYARLDEVRASIGRLREAGKPVYGYADFLTRPALYAGSACDSLFLLRNGYVFLSGVAAERPFVAGMLEKLGIRENLHRIEHYKSAAEMIQRRDLSPTSRANLEWILDATYPAFLRTVEEGRKLAAGSLETFALAKGAMGTQEAKELGLVDRLVFWDEVESALLRISGVEKRKPEKGSVKEAPARPRVISGQEYARVERGQAGIKGKKTLAVVHAAGMIQGEQSGFSFPFGASMGSATMEEAFRQAATDENVAGILFRVESGGGESHTSWRIQRAALRARELKPMVVSLGDLAASGGYLICYPCEPILAGKLSVVGSIGSISGKFNLHGFYDKIGVTKDFVTRGPHALMASDYFDYTPEERAVFEREHWADYQYWVADIARARGKTAAEIDSVGRGRVWTGEQALAHGLIDRLGTYDDAIALLKEKAGIPAAEEVKLVHYPRKKGALEALRSGGLAAAIVTLADQALAPLRRPATWAVDCNDYR